MAKHKRPVKKNQKHNQPEKQAPKKSKLNLWIAYIFIVIGVIVAGGFIATFVNGFLKGVIYSAEVSLFIYFFQKIRKKGILFGKVSADMAFEPIRSNTHTLGYIFIVIFAFVLYGNSIENEYALDDSIVIVQNEFTQQGVDGIGDILSYDTFVGFWLNSYTNKTAKQIQQEKKLVAGGRYRPLSLVTFAIEHSISKNDPHLSHIINILLYALTGLLLYNILAKLLAKYSGGQKWYLSLPFIATLIYIAHPVHTEVVANIKGRDEIMTLLGSLAALYFTLKYLDKKKLYFLIFSSISLFLGLLSKENAITFLALIPLSVHYFTKHSFKWNMISLLPLLFAAGIFLLIRGSILGTGLGEKEIANELMNNPFLHPETGVPLGQWSSLRLATIFSTLGYYIVLLLYPKALTFDYYPYQFDIINWSDYHAYVPLIFYVFIGFYGLYSIFKGKSISSYAIWFFIIPLSVVSNIFFPVGTFMNERFIFISSIGFCIIIAYILTNISSKAIKNKIVHSSVVMILIIVLLGLYSFKTIDRNPAWENDYTLFTTDVKTSFSSAKSTCSAGGKITEEVMKLREIRVNAKNTAEILNRIEKETLLSNIEKREFYDLKDLEKLKTRIEEKEYEMLAGAIKYLEQSVSIHPRYVDALLLLGNAHFHDHKNFEEATEAYMRILKINPNYDRAYQNLDIIFNQCEDIDLMIKTWEGAYTLNKNRFETNYNLGNLYGRFKNDVNKAIPFLTAATKINPNSAKAFKDLGVAYGLSQKYQESIPALEKAVQLDPNDTQILINLGITYQLMGQDDKALIVFNKAKTIDPNIQIPQVQ